MQGKTILRLLIAFFIGLLLIASHVFFFMIPVAASTNQNSFVPYQIYERDGFQAMTPDWSQITFATLPAIAESGQFSAPTDWSEAIGYDVSRQWRTGQTPDQYLKLGDFQDSLYLQLLSLQKIAESSQATYDISNVVLEEFELAHQQTIGSLIEAVPELANFNANQIAPIVALLNANKITPSDKTLGQLLQWKPELKNLKLGTIKLNRFSIGDIPGLKDTSLSNLKNWQNATISQIPGLKDVPFNQFPVSLVTSGAIGVIDIAYGIKESDRSNTITGSDKEGFQVPCRQNCAYAELTGTKALHGKQWISGKYQTVKGGHGILGKINGGKEPTGRHPFGKLFKVVIWDVIEREGRVDTALFFRVCQRRGFVDLGCTPYFIGPIPFMSYHERDPILVGFLDDQGGATTGASIPAEVFEKAQAAGVPLSEESNWIGGDGSLCGEVSGNVDLAALAAGISGIEGGYQSIGSYDPKAEGRGLGRYQYMTFRSDVRATILKHPGGADFLQRADVNNNSDAYRSALERELPQYFTQSEQDALFKQDQRNNIRTAMQQIDPQTGKPFTGNRLIERLGQIHFGGSDARLIDSGVSDIHGRLSMYSYGKELIHNYQLALKKQGQQTCAGSGKVAGRLIYPEGANAPIPDGGQFGADRGDHDHAGVDFAVPTGTPIKAADGGVIEFAGRTDPDGYGTLIIINHGNGLKTHYGHPSEISVKTGQKVTQGQIIGGVGSEGRSTGPHLHFEVRKNGTPVDPMLYLRK